MLVSILRGLLGFDDGVCFECTFSYLMPNVDSMGSKGITNAMQRIGMNLSMQRIGIERYMIYSYIIL
jgi:hypothetical protein